MKKFIKVLVVVLLISTLTACSNTKGKLIVGTNAEFPPFEYVNDEGEIDGFDIAMVNEIAKRIKYSVEITNMEFNSLIAAMEAGNINMIAAAMTVDETRKKSVDFSDSYYTATQYVIVGLDSDIATIEDLEGKVIAVQEGTTGDFIASDDVGASDVKRFKKGVDAIMTLRNGGVDAVIIDSNPAKEFVKANIDYLKYIEGLFDDEYYALAMTKGDTELAKLVNDALEEMKSDGTFDKLLDTYINE